MALTKRSGDAELDARDPFDHLENEHREVEGLFKEIEADPRAIKRRTELFKRLNEALTLHAAEEERIVYPVLKRLEETSGLMDEAVEEHEAMKEMLMEISALDARDKAWPVKVAVLKELVMSHVKEEEGETFKKAREALDDERKM